MHCVFSPLYALGTVGHTDPTESSSLKDVDLTHFPVPSSVPNAIGQFSFTANHKAINEAVHSNSLQVSPAGLRNMVSV